MTLSLMQNRNKKTKESNIDHVSESVESKINEKPSAFVPHDVENEPSNEKEDELNDDDGSKVFDDEKSSENCNVLGSIDENKIDGSDIELTEKLVPQENFVDKENVNEVIAN